MKRFPRFLCIVAAGAFAAGSAIVSFSQADEKDPNLAAIDNVMDVAHKGDKKANVEPLCKVITSGKGTHETADQLLKLYKALAAAKPPKGDEADWKTRTEALVTAAEDLDKGDMPSKEAISVYKKALDCKGCHMAHKPK